MGFNRTSEGRVFFKNPDNDDKPQSAASGGGNAPSAPSSPSPSPAPSEPILAKDQMQMQILLLLKSLNAKLKENKEDTESIRQELQSYREILDGLEEKAETHQTNYIELEQKVSRKQNEVNKKAVRVEETVKSTIQQFSEARKLIDEIEAKSRDRDKNLETLKTEVAGYKKVEGKLAEKQKTLEEAQKEQAAKLKEQAERVKAQSEKFKEQSGKMNENLEAYVALTLRVNETETRQQALDNKIEEATSEFIKLDRKIDKALEDRNRMLRKIERIENAVMETRDALNAKAMVLLTSQGAVAGIDIPKIGDDVLRTDPMALSRRLEEEALMPWWRKPVRLQSPVLVLLGIVILLLGWIMGQSQNAPVSAGREKAAEQPQTVSLYQEEKTQTENSYNDTQYAQPRQEERAPVGERLPPPPSYSETVRSVEFSETADSTVAKPESTDTPDFGITIHKGGAGEAEAVSASTPVEEVKTVDINNEKQMLEVLEAEPEKLAARLNEIEPGEAAETEIASAAPIVEREELPPVPEKRAVTSADLQALRNRITPDPRLPEIAKKIEAQAFDGVPEAQHDMGAIYVAGHGNIKKDISRAILWFDEAAKNGIANAKYNLAVLYHQGMGVRQDVDKAMRLYEEAAVQNHPEAQYNLGIAYIEGIGVTYNPQKAAGFFESAAKRGVTEAAYNLGLIYENGLLGETRPDDALTWYKIAADKGSPEARNALEQLAQSLGIGLGDVNRIADRVRQTKMQGAFEATAKPDTALVSEIQSELTRHGFYSGDVDGVMGPMTANSIRRYQTATHLPIDGKPTQGLLNAMRGASSYN